MIINRNHKIAMTKDNVQEIEKITMINRERKKNKDMRIIRIIKEVTKTTKILQSKDKGVIKAKTIDLKTRALNHKKYP